MAIHIGLLIILKDFRHPKTFIRTSLETLFSQNIPIFKRKNKLISENENNI